MVDPTPLVRPIRLDGPGPFRLPKLFGPPELTRPLAWDFPILELDTEHGQKVLIPIESEAVTGLLVLLQAWLTDSRNPKRPGR